MAVDASTRIYKCNIRGVAFACDNAAGIDTMQTLKPSALALPWERALNGLLALFSSHPSASNFTDSDNGPVLAGCLKVAGAYRVFCDHLPEAELANLSPTLESYARGLNR